jgi:hypothetical protein
MAVEQAAQAAKDVANGAVNAGKGLFRGALSLPGKIFDIATSTPVLLAVGAVGLTTAFAAAAAPAAMAATAANLSAPTSIGAVFNNVTALIGTAWTKGIPALIPG